MPCDQGRLFTLSPPPVYSPLEIRLGRAPERDPLEERSSGFKESDLMRNASRISSPSPVHPHRRKRSLRGWYRLLLALMVPFAGCDEEPEPPPPNPPQILNGSLECRMLRGTYALESATFLVEDLDGVETLGEPEATVLTYQLSLTGEPIPAPMEGEGEGEAEGPACASEACQIRYSWVRQEEVINCGEMGDALEISLRVEDEDGFYHRAQLTSTPQ